MKKTRQFFILVRCRNPRPMGIVSITSCGSQNIDTEYLMDQFAMRRIEGSMQFVVIRVLKLSR